MIEKQANYMVLIQVFTALLILSVIPDAYARSDFDVHPRSIEGRIDGERVVRDTLVVDNYDGDDPLIWTLEVVAEVEGWIDVSRQEGEIPAGREMIVVVIQDGRELEEDHYYADLNFESNDPTRPEFTVPVAGHTVDYPAIYVGWPNGWGDWWGIDMNQFLGDLEWGQEYGFNLNVRNTGRAELIVDELNSSDGYWEIEPNSFRVAGNQAQVVGFTFTADEVGPNSTTITSISNAWDPRELYFRIIASVDPVFRMGTPIPDLEIDEDAAETLVADLDSVFICSDSPEYELLEAIGLTARIERNGEFYLGSRPHWFGDTRVILNAGVEDSVLTDTFLVTVNGTPDAPRPFDLLNPRDGDTLRWDSEDSVFTWQSSTDPDRDDVRYDLTLWAEEEDEYVWFDLIDTTLTYRILDELLDIEIGGAFSWTVAATDGFHYTAAWSIFHNYVVSTGIVDSPQKPVEFRLMEVFPNPFNGSIEIIVNLDPATEIDLSVWDTEGRYIKTIYSGCLSGRTNNLSWKPENLPSGAYIMKLNYPSGKLVKTVQYLK